MKELTDKDIENLASFFDALAFMDWKNKQQEVASSSRNAPDNSVAFRGVEDTLSAGSNKREEA